MTFRLIIAAIGVLALAGCASNDPFIRDSGRPNLKTLTSVEQSDKLSYLARHLLTSKDRKYQDARLQKKLVDTSNSTIKIETPGTIGMLAAQASTGNMFTSKGAQIYTNTGLALTAASMAMPAASMLMESGAMDGVSGFYLPPGVDGQPLDDATQATQQFWKWREQQVARAAGATQRSWRCIWQCDSQAVRVYALQRTNLQPDQRYLYNPTLLYVRVSLFNGSMKPVAADPLLSWALGFVPKWSSGEGNTAPLTLQEAKLDQSGNPEYKDDVPLVSWHQPVSTPLGRDLLRQLYAGSEFDFFATRGLSSDWMGYHGEIYSFDKRNGDGFIEYRVEEKPPVVAVSQK